MPAIGVSVSVCVLNLSRKRACNCFLRHGLVICEGFGDKGGIDWYRLRIYIDIGFSNNFQE